MNIHLRLCLLAADQEFQPGFHARRRVRGILRAARTAPCTAGDERGAAGGECKADTRLHPLEVWSASIPAVPSRSGELLEGTLSSMKVQIYKKRYRATGQHLCMLEIWTNT
jgi:hypothetical protein